MSHQTGIRANEELKKFFGKCQDGKVRAVKITIENEELILSKHQSPKGTWEKDFDKFVPPLIEDDQPCYILYRFDSTNSLGHEWLFISWSPDTAAVRQKMLYASTKATLKKEFGSAHLSEELHGSVKEEITLAGYKKYLRNVHAPAPLTEREEALKTLQITEHNTNFSPDSRQAQSNFGGVSFPVTEAAMQALADLKRGSYNYLQFSIDIEEEKINLSLASLVEMSELPEQVPSGEARYHLYVFTHTHEGDRMDSIVFIYSMPGYKCSIKERMLYSSCKATFLETIAHAGLEVAKRLEIDEGKELTEEFLQEELHPKRSLHRPAFAKPKGPPNRGAKRLTKPQPN